jgi:micrococcal nuclease
MPARRAAWVRPLALALVVVAGACAGEGGPRPAGGPAEGEATPPATRPEPSRPSAAAPATSPAPRSTTAPGGRRAVVLAGRVSSVIDGDTITVEARGFETTVRLVGIDTPETRHPTEPVQCFGPAASERTERLLPEGRRVRLVSDPTQDTRDRYGRLLAYVYAPGRSGPAGSVNFALVRTGHAKAYVYGGTPFRHAPAFLRAEERAREEGAGLWGPPCHGDTDAPDPSPPAPPPPAPAPAAPAAPGPAEPRAGCDRRYGGACVPVHPPDVNCNELPDRNFRVLGDDVHRLDVDGDGIACEA